MITDITTYQQLVKQYIAEQADTTNWSNYLKGLKTPYEAQGVITQQQTAYDISGAYANYKQSQLNLLRNRNLSESLKNQLSESTRASYQSAYGQLRTQELENLQSIQSAYEKQVAAEEKAANEQAINIEKLDRALYAFAGLDRNKRGDTRGDNGGLGYYATEDLEDGGIETYLTPYGKAELGYALFNLDESDKSFSDYLYETDEDLYEAYMKDPSAFHRTLGFEPGTTSFSEVDRDRTLYTEIARSEYPDLYEKGLSISDSSERGDYYIKEVNARRSSNVSTKYPSIKELLSSKNKYEVIDTLNELFYNPAVVDVSGLGGGRLQLTIDSKQLTVAEKKSFEGFDYAELEDGRWKMFIRDDNRNNFSTLLNNLQNR